jgi:hypothetical protein
MSPPPPAPEQPSAPASVPRSLRVSAPLARVRGATVDLKPPPRPRPTSPSRVARMLALGHEIVRLVGAGLLKDQADAADLLGFTRARISQIVDLTLLAPDIQEALLFGDEGTGQAERRLRGVVAVGDWAAQREKFRMVRPSTVCRPGASTEP